MAIGWKPSTTHALPAGRRSFTDSPGPKPDIVRPGRYADGQNVDGTPAGRESTKAASRSYADGKAYRADPRGETSRGLTGRPAGEGPNPSVQSKAVRRYGVDGSQLHATHSSTGRQPGAQQRDFVPPSIPQRTYTGRLPPGGLVRQVGFPGGGKPFVEVNYDATMRRHGSDGIHDPATSTDNASGQAHSASGGRFGNPQVRPAPKAPSGTQAADTGALDRASYLGTKK